MPTSTTVSSLGSTDVFTRSSGGRDGIISPLDYVKNRIVEVMRTENQDEKSEETNISNDQVIQGCASHSIGSSSGASQIGVPSSSTPRQVSEPCSSTCGQSVGHSHISITQNETLNTNYDNSSTANAQVNSLVGLIFIFIDVS